MQRIHSHINSNYMKKIIVLLLYISMFALNISALEDEEPEQKSNTKYPVVYRHGKVVLKSGPSIHRKPANIVLDFIILRVI